MVNYFETKNRFFIKGLPSLRRFEVFLVQAPSDIRKFQDGGLHAALLRL